MFFEPVTTMFIYCHYLPDLSVAYSSVNTVVMLYIAVLLPFVLSVTINRVRFEMDRNMFYLYLFIYLLAGCTMFPHLPAPI